MPYHFLEVAITPNVRRAQAEMGADQIWLADHHRASDSFTESELAFIAARDSFYIASVSETDWPMSSIAVGRRAFSKPSTTRRWLSPTTGVTANISAPATSPHTTEPVSF